MNDIAKPTRSTRSKVEAGLRRRHRRETLFRLVGLLATAVGIVFLGVFFISLFALDVFNEDFSIKALLIHLIPCAILAVAIIIAWKMEFLGGLLFLVLGLAYLFFSWKGGAGFNILNLGIMGAPLFFIGVLFLSQKISMDHK